MASGSLVVREPADRKAACVLTRRCKRTRWNHIRCAFTFWIPTTHLTSLPALQLRIPEFLVPGARFPLPNAQDANQRSNGVLSYRLSPSQHFRLHLGLRVGRSE